MKILVTGFMPFGGETVNPAYEAVRRLPAQIAGADIATVEIPVVYKKGPAAVEAAIEHVHRYGCLSRCDIAWAWRR